MDEPFVKKSVTLPDWIWGQLSVYQKAHGCISQADALRRVLSERFGPHESMGNAPAQPQASAK